MIWEFQAQSCEVTVISVTRVAETVWKAQITSSGDVIDDQPANHDVEQDNGIDDQSSSLRGPSKLEEANGRCAKDCVCHGVIMIALKPSCLQVGRN